MGTLNVRTHVNAPRSRVFEVFTDIRNSADRVSKIERIEMLTDGPTREGTRWRETRKMGKRDWTEELVVSSMNAPESFEVTCESMGCRYTFSYAFIEDDSGTEVRLGGRTEPLKLVTKLMMPLMKPMLKKMEEECQRDMEELARVAEGGA